MTKQQFLAMSLPYKLAISVISPFNSERRFEEWLTAMNYDQHYQTATSKPILHPLFDLTKEIEHNGEKFIPIVELLKIEQSSGLKYATINHKVIKIDVHESSEGNTYKLEYSEPYSNIEDGLIQFSYSERFRRFGKVMFKPYKQPLGIGFQLDMFQKLIEWHFDIAELIEKGEAIDVNTLFENPYK